MKTIKTALCIALLSMLIISCVHASKKCKQEHKAAKKKGTSGWRY